jgi:hypothetical protein
MIFILHHAIYDIIWGNVTLFLSHSLFQDAFTSHDLTSLDPKGHVMYCHHFVFASIMPKLLHCNLLLWNQFDPGAIVIRSYGSWIYNYLCNQCLSPLKFEPRSWQGLLDTALSDKVCQLLATGCGFLRVLWFSPPIKLTATI